jgi:eukaryotic-like serine/threonine-protein kinase
VLIVIAAGGFRLFFHRSPVLTEKDTVVLADFTNSTGDSVFDDTLRQGLLIQLAQSPFVSQISDERIQQTLRLMGRPADSRLTPELAKEICERTGSAAVLEGSIAPLGSQYVLGFRARNCRTGDVISEEQVQANRKEDALRALDQIATKFRSRVGESLTSVGQHDTPLAEATTSSLEALKAYSEGWKAMRTRGEVAAAPLFERAIQTDPKFAMAYGILAVMHSSIGDSTLAERYATKAYQLRDRANDREKFFITAYYDGRVTGNMEKAQQTCETWATTYPRDDGPSSFLGGFIDPTLAEYEQGVAAGEKIIELSPDFQIGYIHRAFNLIALGRLEEAKGTLRTAAARGVEVPFSLIEQHDIAFLKADKSEMDRLVAKAQENSDAEIRMSDHEAGALAFSGRLQHARMLSQHAIDAAQQTGFNERAGFFATRVALREAFYGNVRAAQQWAKRAQMLGKGREVEYGAAFALALSGASSQAEALANDLEKRFPEDTAVRFSYLPALSARLALNRHEPSIAIEKLQSASHYELGSPRSAVNALFGAMYPVYVRGEAYLAEHRGVEAAAEFQKILDNRGIVISDPIGALSHLQLGRAYAISGDKSKAKSAYRDFLDLWKDADPDIPLLAQAKAEYVKLQ